MMLKTECNMKYLFIILGIIFNLSAADMPTEPFVVSTGQAKVEVKPDEATLKFRLQVTRETSDDGLKSFTERSHAVQNLMINHRISPQHISASELDKDPIYNHRQKSSGASYKISAYRFTRSYTVEIKDLKMYPKLMEALLKMDNIFRSQTTFDISNREEIENKLMSNAMSKARKKASTMAAIAGAKIKGVYAISDTGLYDLGARFILGQESFGEDGFDDSSGFGRSLALTESIPKLISSTIEIPKSIGISAEINTIFSLSNK